MTSRTGGEDADVSLSGNLEDVPLADVLQFIHLGRRTGTLSLSREDEEAEIGFHNGQIVSADSPSSKRLGERLVEEGLVSPEKLAEGLERQRQEQQRQSLGSILVSEGVVNGDRLRRAVEAQIAETVYELVTWTRGVFQFTLDELRPVDGIGMYPGDLIPHIDLNTQMVLLEATRIFDERNREGAVQTASEVPIVEEPDVPPPAPALERTAHEAEPAEPLVEEPPPLPVPELFTGDEHSEDGESLRSLLAGVDAGNEGAVETEEEDLQEARAKPGMAPRLQVLTKDVGFYDTLSHQIDDSLARPVRIRPHEAGIALGGEPPPIVLFDLRHGAAGPQDIRALRGSRPRAPIIALVDESIPSARVFEAGALAALPADWHAVCSCVESIIRNRLDLAADELRAPAGSKSGLQRLRRILADLRSGLLSATVALNLLHIISESVERAILFLVKPEELSALGAFGFSEKGELLAQVTRGFRLARNGAHPLASAVDDGQVRSISFDEAAFPAQFVELVGRPMTGQVVIFPVLGAQRVISVIYADNGQTSRVIEDIDVLELATAQVGMAFENELLRRQAAREAKL